MNLTIAKLVFIVFVTLSIKFFIKYFPKNCVDFQIQFLTIIAKMHVYVREGVSKNTASKLKMKNEKGEWGNEKGNEKGMVCF